MLSSSMLYGLNVEMMYRMRLMNSLKVSARTDEFAAPSVVRARHGVLHVHAGQRKTVCSETPVRCVLYL